MAKLLGNDVVTTAELQQYVTRIESIETVIMHYAKMHKIHLTIEALLLVAALLAFFR
jgi:hypothetical protein